MKTAKQLERHFKGVANHRRIEIIKIVAKQPGITLEHISEALKCNFKTISEHSRRLVAAGLMSKKYRGREVMHELTPYGERFYRILLNF